MLLHRGQQSPEPLDGLQRGRERYGVGSPASSTRKPSSSDRAYTRGILTRSEAAMDIEDDVAAHYHHPGLEALILDGLAALGQDPDNIDPDVLAAADQLHIGGTDATRSVAEGAGLRAGMRVLDVGGGIGGPARYLAHHLGVTVRGVDLTPESVRTAESLTRRSGLEGLVQFSVASALELPFDDGSFDAATMLHVGMNIADKAGAFREIHRVLKPGGIFALYDIMSTSPSAPQFPLPWASTPASSFVEDRTGYLAALDGGRLPAGGRTQPARFRRRVPAADPGQDVRFRRPAAGHAPADGHRRHGEAGEPGGRRPAGRACPGGAVQPPRLSLAPSAQAMIACSSHSANSQKLGARCEM